MTQGQFETLTRLSMARYKLNARERRALKILRAMQYEEAERYECADCGHHGYGGWNCLQCGQHNLIRSY